MKVSNAGVALGVWLHAMGALAQEPADEASIARELEQLRSAALPPPLSHHRSPPLPLPVG